MSRENPNETKPGRRSLLRAAAAGGVFAVPLIASFSMDATVASAAPRPAMAGHMSASMYTCANQARGVPTGLFYAQLSIPGSGGPVRGLAGFEVLGRRDELVYEFAVPGKVSYFTIKATDHSLVAVADPGKNGKIAASVFVCKNNHAGPPAGLADLFELMAGGAATANVSLDNGIQLTGPIALGPV